MERKGRDQKWGTAVSSEVFSLVSGLLTPLWFPLCWDRWCFKSTNRTSLLNSIRHQSKIESDFFQIHQSVISYPYLAPAHMVTEGTARTRTGLYYRLSASWFPWLLFFLQTESNWLLTQWRPYFTSFVYLRWWNHEMPFLSRATKGSGMVQKNQFDNKLNVWKIRKSVASSHYFGRSDMSKLCVAQERANEQCFIYSALLPHLV